MALAIYYCNQRISQSKNRKNALLSKAIVSVAQEGCKDCTDENFDYLLPR